MDGTLTVEVLSSAVRHAHHPYVLYDVTSDAWLHIVVSNRRLSEQLLGQITHSFLIREELSRI